MDFLIRLYQKMNAWVWKDLPSYPDIYISLRKAGYCEFDALELANSQYDREIRNWGICRKNRRNSTYHSHNCRKADDCKLNALGIANG